MQPTSTFGSFLVGALCASWASASAIPKPGTFEIKRAANPNFRGFNGPMALVRAQAKFGLQPSDELVASAQAKQDALYKRDSGSVKATATKSESQYICPVQIGTPAQTLNLDFDTGSSDLWVFSSETESLLAGLHDLYTPEDSSTSSKQAGSSWRIRYGDGSTSKGDVYTDVVTIGGLTVDKQAVEAAQDVSATFAIGANDGLVGLGFDNINTVKPTKVETWFDNVAPSLDAGLFVADLRHGDDQPGSYVFGSVPSEASDPLYGAVDKSNGWWEFDTTMYGVSGTAIADTGTSLIAVADKIVKAYYADVPSATSESDGWYFDCDADLPDFVFTVGGKKFSVPGSLIPYAEESGNSCYGGVQSSEGLGVSILGDVALKAAYVIFDMDNMRIGWAKK